MLNDGQSVVTRNIIAFMNENFEFNGKYRLDFDKLSTSKDSMCLTTTKDSAPVEKPADVTGGYVSGTLRLGIVLRVMKVQSGMQDLDYIKICDALYQFLKSNYRSIKNDEFYIDKVSQISGAKLDAVYQGGVKDFRGIFEVTYERKVG